MMYSLILIHENVKKVKIGEAKRVGPKGTNPLTICLDR